MELVPEVVRNLPQNRRVRTVCRVNHAARFTHVTRLPQIAPIDFERPPTPKKLATLQ
jgi:hypothetical protein